MPKVSVIVPVCGVEKYIERCVRSLFEQTLQDIEFIFVNDCTQDNSIHILEDVLKDYPKRISQTRIIHHEKNLGLPLARKTGLSVATGDFIAHCDSDDWVDQHLYTTLLEKAEAECADIVICDFIAVKGDCQTVHFGTRATTVDELNVNMLYQSDTISIWNKLFRRSLFDNGIIQPTANMGEDMAITLQVVRYAKKIAYITDAFYYYNCSSLSISRIETKEATANRASQACQNARLIAQIYDKVRDDKIQDGLTHLKYMQRKLYMPAINYKDVYLLWKQSFPEINAAVLFKRSLGIPFIERLKFFLTLINVFPWIKQHTRKNLE